MARFVSFKSKMGEGIGVIDGKLVHNLTSLFDNSTDLLPLIETGKEGLEKALIAKQKGQCRTLEAGKVDFKAPIKQPRKIVAIGLNYIDHCREASLPIPKTPVVFTKHTNSVVGPNDEICWRESVTKEVDYEVELGVIIGSRTKRVSTAGALSYVFGYTVVNDVSARDLQLNSEGGQWDLGKSLDTFCPSGPLIVTADEIPNPQNLPLELRLNGQIRQNSNTCNMIFSVAELISYLSTYMTLEPGDLICTGTPPGVGMGMNPKGYMTSGDICEAEIAGIGTLRNKVRIIK